MKTKNGILHQMGYIETESTSSVSISKETYLAWVKDIFAGPVPSSCPRILTTRNYDFTIKGNVISCINLKTGEELTGEKAREKLRKELNLKK